MKDKVTALRLPKNDPKVNKIKVTGLKLPPTALPKADKLVEMRRKYEAYLKYETDGHYSTVYLVCLMLGMDKKFAQVLAKATEAPDTTVHDELRFELNDTWGHPFGPQQKIHSLTGGFHGIEEFFTAIKFLYTPNDKIEELGKLLHRFGDTYAHTKIDNLKPDDIKEHINLEKVDDETIKKYIESWQVGSEQTLKSKVEPWVTFFNYYMREYGIDFLENESKQKNIFQGKTLKEALKDIYLPKGTSDFIMYGKDGYTGEHAFADGGYPDMIYLRPNWYFIYVQNLAWLIANKYNLEYSKLDLSLFNKMLDFLKKNQKEKPSMKGIIDYEIAKFLGKKEFYVPLYYPSAIRIGTWIDAYKTDYAKIASKVVELSKKYLIEQGISPEKIKVEAVHQTTYTQSHEPLLVVQLIAYKITF